MPRPAPPARSNRSAALLKLGDAVAAEEDARAAIKLRPDWEKAYYRFGAALEAQGDLDMVGERLACSSGAPLGCTSGLREYRDGQRPRPGSGRAPHSGALHPLRPRRRWLRSKKRWRTLRQAAPHCGSV